MDSEWSNSPFDNWQASGSFLSGWPVPSSMPGDVPLVCISVNSQWIPLIVACLQQLQLRQTWDTSDLAVLANAFGMSADLAAIVGNAANCNPIATGLIWAANGNNTLSQFATGGVAAGPVLGSGALDEPVGVLVVEGQVWIANFAGNNISHLNFDGSSAGPNFTGTGMSNPVLMAQVPSAIGSLTNYVWVAANGNSKVYRFNLDTTLHDIITPVGILPPLGVCVVGTQVWVSCSNSAGSSYKVLRLNFDGSTAATPLASGLSEYPNGITVIGSQVWITQVVDNSVSRWNFDGSSAGAKLTGNGLNEPYQAATVGNQVWVANVGNNSISVFNFDGTPAIDLVGNGMSNPRGLAVLHL